MSEIRLGAVESKFADIIWNNEPLRPVELEKLAEAELNWKRTTTLTILKRLCERGIFQNKDRMITSLISREEFYALQSESLWMTLLKVHYRLFWQHSVPERSYRIWKWRN